MLGELPDKPVLEGYADWWREEGKQISESVDKTGTPWLQMFDRQGERVDRVRMPGDYRKMLLQGYRSGVVWRAFRDDGLPTSFLLGYITAFYDPGLYCPYTVSLSTAMPLAKYGNDTLKANYLEPLLRDDDQVWQGATWMTEIGGGSDLGRNVETAAVQNSEGWQLTGDKYFASNAGAELAVVAARPAGAPEGVRGLALFLVPRMRRNGTLNYQIRRMKDKTGTRSVPTGEVELRDSEAFLLGQPEHGIYHILEVLNLSRTANSIGSVALMQRAVAEALRFAQNRVAFGRPIIEQPLLRTQIEQKVNGLEDCFALAWGTCQLFSEVWEQKPPYTERYLLFRLMAHVAKYRTAELAAQTAKWAMEVHGGLGVLAEFPVERLFREAMVLAIWEGTSHRQILDALAVMQAKEAHKLLPDYLGEAIESDRLADLMEQIDDVLKRPGDEAEAAVEGLFVELSGTIAKALRHRLHAKT